MVLGTLEGEADIFTKALQQHQPELTQEMVAFAQGKFEREKSLDSARVNVYGAARKLFDRRLEVDVFRPIVSMLNLDSGFPEDKFQCLFENGEDSDKLRWSFMAQSDSSLNEFTRAYEHQLRSLRDSSLREEVDKFWGEYQNAKDALLLEGVF